MPSSDTPVRPPAEIGAFTQRAPAERAGVRVLLVFHAALSVIVGAGKWLAHGIKPCFAICQDVRDHPRTFDDVGVLAGIGSVAVQNGSVAGIIRAIRPCAAQYTCLDHCSIPWRDAATDHRFGFV